jgi:DNA-binding winged helix-turn-helix (wHTH) protein
MKKYKTIFSLNENTLEIQNLQNGKVRNLTLNQFRLLECLIQGKGKKSEIIDYVWLANNIVVSDGSYHQLIFQTRAIFDSVDLAGGMIKTFPRYGLKLVDYSEVKMLSGSGESTNVPDELIDLDRATIENIDISPDSLAVNQALSSKKKTESVTSPSALAEAGAGLQQTNESVYRRHTSYISEPIKVTEVQLRKQKSHFFNTLKISRFSIILICSFFVGAGCSFFVLSPVFGFYIFKYINHPPMVFSENQTTIFSDTINQNSAKEGIELLDKVNAQNGKNTRHSYRYGLMDDFYVYKTLILCQVGKEPRTWLSSGAICENYILDY